MSARIPIIFGINFKHINKMEDIIEILDSNNLRGIYTKHFKFMNVSELQSKNTIGDIRDIHSNYNDEERMKAIIERVKYVYDKTGKYIQYTEDELFNDEIAFGFNPVTKTNYKKEISDLKIKIETFESTEVNYINKIVTVVTTDIEQNVDKTGKYVSVITTNSDKFTSDEEIANRIIELLSVDKANNIDKIENVIY